MNFKIITQNKGGSEKWTLNYIKATIREELNKDRTATVSFAWEDLKATADADDVTPYYILSNGYREVYIYDKNNNIIFSGVWGNMMDSKTSDGKGVVNLPAFGFFTLLNKRHTAKEKKYSSEDSADIAWDLIDTTQNETNGDLGITRGTHPTTKNRQRTFYFETVKKAIEGMSGEEVKEGFDFEVDLNKIFNIYYPEKGSLRGIIIIKDGRNLNSFQIAKTGLLSMCNDVTVIGEGYGADTISENRTAESTYAENFGLLEDVLPEKNVSIAETLQNKGDRYLEEFKNQRFTLSLNVFYDDPEWLNYEVGDRLKIEIPSRNINGFYRLLKRKLYLNEETVELTLRNF